MIRRWLKSRMSLLRSRGSERRSILGSQIRSYVMQPYQLVKDLRTDHERGDVDSILDGDIDSFIESYLMSDEVNVALTMPNEQTVRIKFLGATRTVTGSKYLVQNGDKKILLDCGLFQGEKQLRLRNWAEPPFNPAELDAVVLSHAHIDHNWLPAPARQARLSPAQSIVPSATAELVPILLSDSAHLQQEEARYANDHGTSKHHPALSAL
jgi:hypothetical protein